jgi:hypothetical protein
MRDSEMENCPNCGSRLAKKLVADIKDPMQDEKCPVRKGSKKEKDN